MRLHAPGVQARLRKATRAAIRRSPTLAAEARRLRRQHRRQWTADDGLLHVLGTGVLVALMMTVVGAESPLQYPYRLALLALWGFGRAIARAQRFGSLMEGDSERLPLLYLPVADDVVCQRQGWKFLRSSLWTWVDYAVVYGLLFMDLIAGGNTSAWIGVPLLATLHWMVTLALAMGIAARPKLARQATFAWLALWGCFLVLLFDRRFLGPWLANQWAEAADWILLILPTGWPVILFHQLLREQRWASVTLLLPMAIVLWIGYRSWMQWRPRFRLQSLDSALLTEVLHEADDAEAWADLPMRTDASGPTARVDEIRAGGFLRPQARWNVTDRLERAAARWFTSREQLLADVTMHPGTGWSRQWQKAAAVLIAGNVLAWSLQQLGSRFFGWVDALTLLVLAGLTLPTRVSVTPVTVGVLPICLTELLRLRTKVWLVRFGSALPLFAGAGLLLAWRLQQPLWTGLAVAGKGAFLLHALFPYAGLLGVTGGSTAEREVRIVSLRWLLGLLACGGMTFVFGLAALTPELSGGGGWMGWACVPAAILPSWVFAAVYVWRFNRCGMDLQL